MILCLQILGDKERLIKRTQLKRSVYSIIGKPDEEQNTDQQDHDGVSTFCDWYQLWLDSTIRQWTKGFRHFQFSPYISYKSYNVSSIPVLFFFSKRAEKNIVITV